MANLTQAQSLIQQIRNSKRSFSFGVVAAVTILTFSYWFFSDSSILKVGQVARVGSYRIYEKDLAAQRKINGVMGGDKDRIDPLIQLVDVYAKAQILVDHGIDLSESALIAEEERIEKNTRDRPALDLIKSVFSSRSDYRRVFVLSTLVNRKIYFEFYAINRDVHRATFKLASEFLNRVIQQPDRFNELAQELGYFTHTFVVEPEMMEDANFWQAKLIKSLSPGQIYDQIIDGQEALVLARRSKDSENSIDVVSIRKRPFEDWYKEEKAKIIIEYF